MANSDNTIKITLDDIEKVSVPSAAAIPATAPVPASGRKNYGSINEAADNVAPLSETRGSIMLQAWFYLGGAGLIGAFLAWAICEPGFVDSSAHDRWGNIWMVPGVVALLCIGFGVAESVVERSMKKAIVRTALAIPLGFIFGFVFYFIANIVFNIGLSAVFEMGVRSEKNPTFWVARAIAWAVFGVAGGIVYGIIGQSGKKAQYGMLGGSLGAAIGGVVFDPIALALGGAAVSRAVGFAIVGLATGAAMGVVESALKHKWLYVSAGPLAGKQFILYKQTTTIGSDQQSDIYLFKDAAILPRHAVLESRGSRVQVRASGPVYVSGQPVQLRVLQDGDLLQIGRYGFRYKEKQKS